MEFTVELPVTPGARLGSHSATAAGISAVDEPTEIEARDGG